MASLARSQAPTTSLRSLIPPQGEWDPRSSSSSYTNFRDRLVNWELFYRNRHISRMVRDWWYYLGRQWIQQDHSRFQQVAQGFVWRDIRRLQAAGAARPRPVTNKIAVQVDNEVARLSRKEFFPEIWTDSQDPAVLTGARTAKQVLEYKLQQLSWGELRDYANLCQAVQGLSVMRIGWDISLSETFRAGAPGALRCSACGAGLASSRAEERLLEGRQGSLKNLDSLRSYSEPRMEYADGVGEYEAELLPMVGFSHCPSCDERGTLRAWEDLDDDEEGLLSEDVLGRPLGVTIPRGNPSIDVCHGSELFPFNGGLGADLHWRRPRVLCRVVAREIEWLEDRYPEFCSQFRPQAPEEIMRVHPILGESDYLTRYNPGADFGVYDNHMLTYEFAVEPYVEAQGEGEGEGEEAREARGEAYYPNRGAYIFMAGDLCLEHGDLEVGYKDHRGRETRCRRVDFPASRHRRRPGEYWANSLVDDMVSPQNRLNHRDSQLIQGLDNFASPQLLAHRQAHLTGPEWLTPGGGRVLYFDLYPGQPQASKPEILQAGSFPSDVWREREANSADIQELGGGADVELGNIPKGLKTTSGLVVSGDNAGQRRQPRERSQKEQYTQVFRQLLHMLCAFREEKETYEVDAPGASMAKVQSFRGADLMGQYNVRITTQAGIEKDIYTREAAAEAKQEGLYDLSDPVARRRYLETRGLPEINETFKRQFDRAQKAAGGFLDKAILPAVDAYIQAPRVWYQILGEVWLSDELAEIQRETGWDDVVAPKIARWQAELDDLVLKDAAARKTYVGMTPEQAQGMYQQALQDQQASLEATKLAQQTAAQAGQPPPVLPPPPPLPPEPVFLPPAYEQRVWVVWQKLLGTQEPWDAEELVPPEQDPEDQDPGAAQAVEPGGVSPLISLGRLMRYRACVEAYRLYAEERDGKRMMGLPQVPMPGGDPLTQLSAQMAGGAGPGAGAGGGEAGRQTNTPTLPEPPPVLPGPAANAAAGGTVPQSVQV